MSFKPIQIAVTATLTFVSTVAWAGPPLHTDDPGVLPQGGWEYRLAIVGEESNGGSEGYSAPELEVAYGFSDTVQGAVIIGRAVVDEPGESSKSDFDALGFELKWQFYQGEKTAVALAPAYSFPLTDSSRDRGIVEDVRVASLPVIASYEAGNWSFNAQAAYESVSSGPNATFAGLAAGYALNEHLLLLAEVYNTQVSGEEEDQTNWNIGLDWTLPNDVALLLSVGSSLTSDLHHDEELDKAFFVGLRYDTE